MSFHPTDFGIHVYTYTNRTLHLPPNILGHVLICAIIVQNSTIVFEYAVLYVMHVNVNIMRTPASLQSTPIPEHAETTHMCVETIPSERIMNKLSLHIRNHRSVHQSYVPEAY